MTLKEFLKEKRALTKFRVNYRIHRIMGRRTKAEAEEYITTYKNTLNAIIGAFTFASTPEGIDYWKALDDEWSAICNNK